MVALKSGIILHFSARCIANGDLPQFVLLISRSMLSGFAQQNLDN